MNKVKCFLIVFFLQISVCMLGATKDAMGIVHFLDGHEEQYEKIVLPYCNNKFIEVENGKEKKKIPFSKIDCLEVWHPKATKAESTNIYCTLETKKNGEVYPLWAFALAIGKHISFYERCDGKFLIDKKYGASMKAVNFWVVYYKPSDPNNSHSVGRSENVFFGNKRSAVKRVLEVIKDDPVLYDSIDPEVWRKKMNEFFPYVATSYKPNSYK